MSDTVPAPPPIRAKLLDMSEAQGKRVDFQAIADAGYCGVLLKATEGAHYVDPTFDADSRLAREANLLVGAYLFLTPHAPVPDQVALFVGTARGRCDFVVVDFEYPPPEKWVPPIDGAMLTRSCLAACNQLSVAFGARTVIALYSYDYFLESLPRTPELALLAEYPLWIAWYPDQKHEPAQSAHPKVPPPWADWFGWQWSGDGGMSAPGVQGVVDHDVLNMGPEEFAQLCLPPLEELGSDPSLGPA